MTTDRAPRAQKRESAWEDPIVAEVRAVRDRLAARFDYDIDRIVDHFIAEQAPRPKAIGKGKRPSTNVRAKAK
ncbi:MAG: hypothetical protein ABI442_11210 [Gemmatimonadaceae bacterium]